MSYLQANYPYDEDISMGYGVWSADTLKKNWGETREKYNYGTFENVIHLVNLTQFLETERDSLVGC